MYLDGSIVFGIGWEIIDVGIYLVVIKLGFVLGYFVGFVFVLEFKFGW